MPKRFLFLFVLSFSLSSCHHSESDLKESLTGNWLLLYPDHKLTSAHQRDVYGRHQDSLVQLYGLKLFTLASDGLFSEMDSLQKSPGRWLLADSAVKIREAGKGFNPFNATYAGLEKGELQLTQFVQLESENIRLNWHFKKIDDTSRATVLFTPQANAWRQVPTSPESGEALQKRLTSMLAYYAVYFELVAKEAIYFSPARLPLPFRYYQHAMGINEVLPANFRGQFFNDRDAVVAYDLLDRGLSAVGRNYPRAENFVVEYGIVLQRLSDWLAKGHRE